MGEVGVNPDRVAQAATALEQLRDALSANVPIIVSTLNSYWSGGTGSHVSLGVLAQASGRAPGDAAGMRTRARLAALWLQQNVNLTGTGLVNIPFSGPALDSADARAEAQALAAAEGSKDPKAALAAIQAIQNDLQDHLTANDTVWLSAFYNQAAPQVAALAATLHRLDAGQPAQQYANRFTALTQASQQIMAAFGQGLAAADKSSGPSRGLTPEAVQAIASAPDAWSAAMLVKYGPPGSSWAANEKAGPQNPDGLSLLAQLTNHVYADLQNGTLRIPLGGGYDRYGMQDQQQLGQALAGNDPVQVMLQADAQNKNASWQVMGGPNGGALAKMLLNSVNGDLPGLDGRFVQGAPNDRGQYPGFFTMVAPGKPITSDHGQIILGWPDQGTVGNFLDAATSAPRGTGTDAKYSATAAANIIQNVDVPITDNGQIQPAYDPAIEKALTNTFLRYLPDIAASSQSPAQLTNAYADPYAAGHPWNINVSQASLSTLLQQLSSTPQNYGLLKGIVAAKMGTALGMKLNGISDGTQDDPATDLASLYGRFVTEEGNLHFTAGQQQDAQNAELNSLISFGESEVGSIPVIGPTASKVLTWDQKLQFLGVPQIPQFSTSNAANAIQQGRQEFSDTQLKTMIPLVQGLVQQGIIKPDPAWYHNGQVVCNGAFNAWWRDNKGMPIQDKSLPGNQYDHLDTWYQQSAVWEQLQNDGFNKAH
ncbi:MAG TPA: hypothetical protein VGN41_14045 [Streptosporangiaceae bacterium]